MKINGITALSEKKSDGFFVMTFAGLVQPIEPPFVVTTDTGEDVYTIDDYPEPVTLVYDYATDITTLTYTVPNETEAARRELAVRVDALEAEKTALAEEKTALEAERSALFAKWESGKAYKVDAIVLYDGKLWSCLQKHTSQDAWYPGAAPSLWRRVTETVSDAGAPAEWVQPDSTNPYKKDDVVAHNGKTWKSSIAGNVWEPGIYGWVEV